MCELWKMQFQLDKDHDKSIIAKWWLWIRSIAMQGMQTCFLLYTHAQGNLGLFCNLAFSEKNKIHFSHIIVNPTDNILAIYIDGSHANQLQFYNCCMNQDEQQ